MYVVPQLKKTKIGKIKSLRSHAKSPNLFLLSATKHSSFSNTVRKLEVDYLGL